MRMSQRILQSGLLAMLLAVGLPTFATAQTAPTPTPAPATPAPATPIAPAPGGTTQPATPAAPSTPSVAQPAPTQPDPPVGASVGEAVVLAAKPALAISGESGWDSGFETLVKSFQMLNDEAKKAGLKVDGRPRALFLQTDDNSFKYQALLPLAEKPATPPTLGQNVTLAETPAGKTLRFPHSGPYDDIDSVYEAITAYLDEKNLTAKGTFLEEYLTDPKDSADPSLEMNIYVFVE